MIKEVDLLLKPALIGSNEAIRKIAARKANIPLEKVNAIRILKRSIDARKKTPHFWLKVAVYSGEKMEDLYETVKFAKPDNRFSVGIIGSGPAGMFAALRLLELGIKPVILERGYDVQLRRRDLRAIQQEGKVNPDSNYCFGEGGAGTYSDGKLYTRSTKRGDLRKITALLVQHGAVEDILVDTHPHIGSNKLPKIVENIRKTILENGGEYHFNSKVTDLIVDDQKIKGVVINDNQERIFDAVILATGHSARDIFELLQSKKIFMEQKPFAMGVRIEHPQALIDKIQYKMPERDSNLPAASYSLNCQINGRGVYSFCMCPGGIVIPAATAPGEIVLNGMSVSRRDSPFANSGMVVEITENDLAKYKEFGVFAGIELQKAVEKSTFDAGDGSQKAPAQRVTDFVRHKVSGSLPDTSYIPGIFSADLHEILPENISARLTGGLKHFSKRVNGYYTDEAILLGSETRTSSPIRIPRDKDSYQHVEVEGLFPAGEGAGYAGGILSAAIDGHNSASMVVKFIKTL